jgi:hypothetical protein
MQCSMISAMRFTHFKTVCTTKESIIHLQNYYIFDLIRFIKKSSCIYFHLSFNYLKQMKCNSDNRTFSCPFCLCMNNVKFMTAYLFTFCMPDFLLAAYLTRVTDNLGS